MDLMGSVSNRSRSLWRFRRTNPATAVDRSARRRRRREGNLLHRPVPCSRCFDFSNVSDANYYRGGCKEYEKWYTPCAVCTLAMNMHPRPLARTYNRPKNTCYSNTGAGDVKSDRIFYECLEKRKVSSGIETWRDGYEAFMRILRSVCLAGFVCLIIKRLDLW